MFDPETSKHALIELAQAHAKRLKNDVVLTKFDRYFRSQLIVWVDPDKNPKQLPEILEPVNWWRRSANWSTPQGAASIWESRRHGLRISLMDEVYPAENWQDNFPNNPEFNKLNCRHPFGAHVDVRPRDIQATLLKRLLTAEEFALVSQFVGYQLNNPRPKFFPNYDSRSDLGWFSNSAQPDQKITEPNHRWKLKRVL